MGIETLVGLSLASTAIGGVTSAIGAQQSASANRQAALYQAQVAANNQNLAAQAATRQEQAGATGAEIQSRKVAQAIATQRAALAASGVDVNQGSALDVQEGTAQTGRYDVLNTLNSALDKAYGTRIQAGNYGNEVNVSLAKAANAQQAGDIATVSSLVSSAGSFGSKWAGYARTGAVPSFGS